MPIKVLPGGASVVLDAEDFDLFDRHSWHVFTLRPSMRPSASRKEQRFGRVYRILLHREIAVRIDPDLISKKRKFRVLPKNGDYLDCRRVNLDVVVLTPSKRGRRAVEPRPTGYRRCGYKSSPERLSLSPASPLWAGGYEFRIFNHAYLGLGRRSRRCINGRPID